MSVGLSKLQEELKQLLSDGILLMGAWAYKHNPQSFPKEMTEKQVEAFAQINIGMKYQRWYSRAAAVIHQLLPDREAEFRELYENRESHKKLTKTNFRIANALLGSRLTRYEGFKDVEVAGMSSCLPLLQTQYAILESAEARFSSSLFDIQQVLQADLFDSEVDAARELNNKGFARAAGAMVGVVLEKHLNTVLSAHGLSVAKKNPCINDYNQKLKDEAVIDIPTWRFIQRLGDIRNLCDHSKGTDPSKENIAELIDGVDKIMKTIA